MRTSRIGSSAHVIVGLLAFAALAAAPTPRLASGQAATPGAAYSCDSVATAGTPAMNHGTPVGMEMASPAAGVEMGIDLLYIDMMIPHHASIIAMAEAALPRLTDERLQQLARLIIETQSVEIAELHGLREDLTGNAMPEPMDEMTMGMMMELMPGMGSMAEMAMLMDSAALVAAFCAADNPDLAFIDLTIPHHEMAITASEALLERSSHEELRALAERVIAGQQAEVGRLMEIRSDLES